MALVLTITSDHKDLMGDDVVRQFGERGGTIGRGLQSDWILPDELRYVSTRHATIDYQGGAYYIADTSTNGLYLNDEDEPLGKGNPRRLFSGDRLRMGEFEMVVAIEEGEELDFQAASASRTVADHVDQLVPEDILKTGIQLLDEEEITGDEEFQSALFGTTRMDRKPPARKASAPPANPLRESPASNGLDGDALLDAFLKGAGVDRSEIHASVDPLAIMENAGKVLREFVDGTTGMLAGRTNVKSMFRLDQTTVLPRHNNPIKLAASTGDSMRQLLVGQAGEYLSPVDSVKEVCRDLKFHQDAMLAAMMTSFKEFADRFDPDELQENFDRTLDRKPLFGSFAKPKYWELYRDLYPIITQTNGAPFPKHFGEEFVRAYEKHIADYKRVDRKDGKAA